MFDRLRVGAVIPARNEEGNIGAVVERLLDLRTSSGQRLIDDLVVCDNGSTDATSREARTAGARVTFEARPGYGRACLKGIAALNPVDAVLFVDGDQSVDLSQAAGLLAALAEGADLAVGSRTLGQVERGAMSLPQVLGNRVASLLIRLLWGQRVSDLGPFRAIRRDALRQLGMSDTAYGWTVEMQVRAIQSDMSIAETPVDCRRRRVGKSKVGGTVRGVIGASVGIVSTILRLRIGGARRSV